MIQQIPLVIKYFLQDGSLFGKYIDYFKDEDTKALIPIERPIYLGIHGKDCMNLKKKQSKKYKNYWLYYINAEESIVPLFYMEKKLINKD